MDFLDGAALGPFDKVEVRKTSSTAAFSEPRPRQKSRREATREKDPGLLGAGEQLIERFNRRHGGSLVAPVTRPVVT
ncbi:MAG: hypothetical protein ACPG77_00715, partial [Nannocystaceae bacterium]